MLSLKVEFLLEPPKIWQEDVDTEVRKTCLHLINSTLNSLVFQDEEDEQEETQSRLALSTMVHPFAVGFAAISLAGEVIKNT